MPVLLSVAAGAMIFIVVEELIPESQSGDHGHAATYGFLLGFWLMLSLRLYTRRILSYISWPLFFGLLDEGIQMFADGRGSDVRDVVIDFSGVVFGLLAALFLLLLVRMFHVLRESKTPL